MLKLTKEEYKESLNELFVYSKHIANKVEIQSLSECYERLEQLINEHFDNPPLKFEELKEGMWVWDNKEKRYGKVAKEEYRDLWLLSTPGLAWGDFEENRFYRKQVEE